MQDEHKLTITGSSSVLSEKQLRIMGTTALVIPWLLPGAEDAPDLEVEGNSVVYRDCKHELKLCWREDYIAYYNVFSKVQYHFQVVHDGNITRLSTLPRDASYPSTHRVTLTFKDDKLESIDDEAAVQLRGWEKDKRWYDWACALWFHDNLCHREGDLPASWSGQWEGFYKNGELHRDRHLGAAFTGDEAEYWEYNVRIDPDTGEKFVEDYGD